MQQAHETTARVEIFTRQMCGTCQELKRQLDAEGIEYAAYDVGTHDGMAMAMWRDVDIQGTVPRMLIDGCAVEAPDAATAEWYLRHARAVEGDNHGA